MLCNYTYHFTLSSDHRNQSAHPTPPLVRHQHHHLSQYGLPHHHLLFACTSINLSPSRSIGRILFLLYCSKVCPFHRRRWRGRRSGSTTLSASSSTTSSASPASTSRSAPPRSLPTDLHAFPILLLQFDCFLQSLLFQVRSTCP